MSLFDVGFSFVSRVASMISLKPLLLTTRASCNEDIKQLCINKIRIPDTYTQCISIMLHHKQEICFQDVT